MGREGEDPTTPFWGHGNYVGPFWSDGKIQSSVEWGSKKPTDEFDALAQQHDAAYAHWKDDKHREAADLIFAEEARKLKKSYGNSPAAQTRFAAAMVEEGNYTSRQAKKLAADIASHGWLGAVKFQIQNMVDSQKRMNGTYLKSELARVREYYDAHARHGGEGSQSPEGKDGKQILPVVAKTPKLSHNTVVPDTEIPFVQNGRSWYTRYRQKKRIQRFGRLKQEAIDSINDPSARRGARPPNVRAAVNIIDFTKTNKNQVLPWFDKGSAFNGRAGGVK